MNNDIILVKTLKNNSINENEQTGGVCLSGRDSNFGKLSYYYGANRQYKFKLFTEKEKRDVTTKLSCTSIFSEPVGKKIRLNYWRTQFFEWWPNKKFEDNPDYFHVTADKMEAYLSNYKYLLEKVQEKFVEFSTSENKTDSAEISPIKSIEDRVWKNFVIKYLQNNFHFLIATKELKSEIDIFKIIDATLKFFKLEAAQFLMKHYLSMPEEFEESKNLLFDFIFKNLIFDDRTKYCSGTDWSSSQDKDSLNQLNVLFLCSLFPLNEYTFYKSGTTINKVFSSIVTKHIFQVYIDKKWFQNLFWNDSSKEYFDQNSTESIESFYNPIFDKIDTYLNKQKSVVYNKILRYNLMIMRNQVQKAPRFSDKLPEISDTNLANYQKFNNRNYWYVYYILNRMKNNKISPSGSTKNILKYVRNSGGKILKKHNYMEMLSLMFHIFNEYNLKHKKYEDDKLKEEFIKYYKLNIYVPPFPINELENYKKIMDFILSNTSDEQSEKLLKELIELESSNPENFKKYSSDQKTIYDEIKKNMESKKPAEE